MERQFLKQWEREDRNHVDELKQVLAALKAFQASYKYSLVQEHKNICNLINQDIFTIDEEIKFINTNLKAMR